MVAMYITEQLIGTDLPVRIKRDTEWVLRGLAGTLLIIIIIIIKTFF